MNTTSRSPTSTMDSVNHHKPLFAASNYYCIEIDILFVVFLIHLHLFLVLIFHLKYENRRDFKILQSRQIIYINFIYYQKKKPVVAQRHKV